MFALPLLLPVAWLLGLVALLVLGIGLFLVVGFLVGIVAGITALATGAALLAFAAVGRFIVLLFHPSGDDEPGEARTGEAERLQRPDGTEIHLEAYGRRDAPALILTHGWGSDSTQWYYAKKALSDEFRVVVWDLPGNGRSGRPPEEDYSLTRMADDLEAVVRHVGDRGAVVVGHSMGGMIILRLARRLPAGDALASGLVLLNTTHVNPLHSTAAGKLGTAVERPIVVPLAHATRVLFPLVWAMNWLSYLNGTMQLMLSLTGFAGTQTRGQLDRVALLGARSHPGVLARQALAMLDHNEVDTPFALDLPVLVVTADRDRITVPQASEQIVRKLPSAELVILRPSGHVSVFERHAELVEALRGFARRTAAAAATPVHLDRSA